jgi:hypothetical protein
VELGHVVEHRYSAGRQLGENSREQLLDYLSPSRKQCVGVASLGYASPNGADLGQNVTIDHRDLPKGLRQHRGGTQATHARPEDHAVVAKPVHRHPKLHQSRRRAECASTSPVAPTHNGAVR